MSTPSKSLSLALTTTQSLDLAMAAIMVSRALLGQSRAVPSAIISAQIRDAVSSKGKIRPAKSARGLSGPENQASSSVRFRPAGFSSTPRRISARVRAAMNRSVSACSFHQARSVWDGAGLTASLSMFVSSR